MGDVYEEKRAAESADRLNELAIYETCSLESISYYKTSAFERPDELPLDEFSPCDVGFIWERNRQTTAGDRIDAAINLNDDLELPESLALGDNVWFRLQFTIPDSMSGHPVYLNFAAEPLRDADSAMGPPRVECLCYRDGDVWQAFDDGHDELRLTDSADGGEEFDLLVEAGTTTLWGLLDVERFVLDTARLYATRESVRELARNYSVLNDLRTELPEDSINAKKILRGLTEASHAFPFDAADEAEYERGAERALDRLEALKSDLSSELTGYEITAVGHAHIDLAWLWPWSETIRKGARSFSNVLKLMDEYPEFTFLQSQPHLYEFVRDQYPELFRRIEQRIEDGRWHPTGALWVESDVNISGGEALARQFLLGKRYFREEFGVDPKIVFIPDVFGYSGALPGIARAADCPYFFTQKMSWNEVNDFPHSSFRWKGIDGSELLAHFPPADTYNGEMTVEQVRRSVRNHDENDVVDESAYLVGWGDGGGGPTRDMMENRDIINDIGSLPDVSFGSLQDFFDRLSESAEQLPEWVGELYLEKHRGTLTTQAETKRNNRKGEFALREAELWSSLALAFDDEFVYDHARLEDAWKVLLFNQFHDILPGSSVTEVYADADRDYEQVFETAERVTADALDALVGTADSSNQLCVTNPLPWTRRAIVEVDADAVDLPSVDDEQLIAVAPDGTDYPVQRSERDDGSRLLFDAPDVPALGAVTFEVTADRESGGRESDAPLEVSRTRLENSLLRVDINDDGTIDAYDVEADRSLFEGKGNQLINYRDHPREFEAWDIEGDVYAVGEQLPAPSEVAVVEDGPVRATVRQRFEFGESTLVQEISLERESRRIDFRTEVDWHEEETLLKAHFPTAVDANRATYDIQFGHLSRDTHDNTSWDEARFEEPHQQWVDVSEHDYGVAVLNDSKYGVNVDGTDVSLSLLRAPNSPDAEADRGYHEFRYAVYPHEGDLREGGVIEAGYEVNAPVTTVPVEESVEFAPVAIDTPGVIVESIKRAEDYDDRLVVRMYEAWGRRTSATLSFGFDVESAAEVNLVEDHERELGSVPNNELSLEFDSFDIRTIMIEL